MKGTIRKLLREPLVHFLVLGAALFLVFDLTEEVDTTNPRRVVITADQVEQLAMQFSRTWLRPPTPAELDGLVERHVRSEIYYREAQALGLAQDDPYVRNRLALKLEFLLDDLSVEGEPDDAVLGDFLAANAERFTEPARLTFRQVFLNPDRHPDPAAEAQQLLASLRAGSDPTGLGDPTMPGSTFDDVDEDEIARQFGEALSDALFDLAPGDWQGPVRSPFGLHLVRVTKRRDARQPALAEIRDAVVSEWRDQRRTEVREQAYQRLRERYEVVMEPATDGQSVDMPANAQAGDVDSAIAAGPGTRAPGPIGARP